MCPSRTIETLHTPGRTDTTTKYNDPLLKLVFDVDQFDLPGLVRLLPTNFVRS